MVAQDSIGGRPLSIINEITFIEQNNCLLIVVNTIVIAVVIIISLEGAVQFFKTGREIK